MPEKQAPDMERIRKRILADYKKGKKPKELAEKYGVNINTLKSWIRRANAPPKEAKKRAADAKKKANTDAPKKKIGAPYGNTNAVGHKGGPPVGNTNALKHGGYSPVYWDTLTDEERELLDGLEYDDEELLIEEIALLTIRERRIMIRIRQLTAFDEKTPSGMGQVVASIIRSEDKREFDNLADKELFDAMQRAKIESGNLLPGRTYSLTTRTEATYDVIHRLEEALTRCQAQKQKCIQALADLRFKRQGETDGGIREEIRIEVEELIRSSGDDKDGNSIPPESA